MRWRVAAPRGVQRPRLVDDVVVLCDADGLVRALARADGAERWRTNVGGNASGAVAATAGVVVIEASDRLIALEARTGRRLWQTTLPEDSIGPAVIASADTVVVGGANGATGLEARTGRRLWRNEDAGGRELHLLSDPATDVVIDSLRVIALDPQTGEKEWELDLSADDLDALIGPATPLDGGPLVLTTGYHVPPHRD